MSTRRIAAFAVSFPPGRVYSNPVPPKLWLGLSLTEATSNDCFCAGGACATTGISVAATAVRTNTKFLLTCRISSWMRCQNPMIQFDSEARLEQSEKRLIEVGDHCLWVCYDTSVAEIAITESITSNSPCLSAVNRRRGASTPACSTFLKCRSLCHRRSVAKCGLRRAPSAFMLVSMSEVINKFNHLQTAHALGNQKRKRTLVPNAKLCLQNGEPTPIGTYGPGIRII